VVVSVGVVGGELEVWDVDELVVVGELAESACGAVTVAGEVGVNNIRRTCENDDVWRAKLEKSWLNTHVRRTCEIFRPS
jgi:hypothetical protein